MKIPQLFARREKAPGDLGEVFLGDAILSQQLEGKDPTRQRPRQFALGVWRKVGHIGFGDAARTKESLDDVLT